MELSEPLKPSAILLILVNLVPLIGVLLFSWEAAGILLIYWSESAIIGFYMILKIIFAKGDIGTPASRFFIVLFLAFHFGMFMLGHLFFLLMAVIPESYYSPLFSGDSFEAGLQNFLEASGNWLFTVMLLFMSHGFSFLTNYIIGGEREKADVGTLMQMPYQRVVVMHITIIFGAMLGAPVLVLVLIKIIFDLRAHLAERGIQIPF